MHAQQEREVSQEKHSVASFLLLWRSIEAEAKVTSNKAGERVLPAATAQFIKQQCGWVLFGFSNFFGGGRERERERDQKVFALDLALCAGPWS